MAAFLFGVGAVVLLNLLGATINHWVSRRDSRDMWGHLAVAYFWWWLGPWALVMERRRRRRQEAERREAIRAYRERYGPDEPLP